jgi:phytoene dehydrogenase-like protein
MNSNGHDESKVGSADVIIVGAGHNGLVAACYLAKAGLDVLVLEASPVIGGMTATNPIISGAPDHQINEGSIQASLFRASSIERDLDLARYGLRQIRIDPPHAHLDPDGASFAMWDDPARCAEELRRFSRRDAEAWVRLSRTLAGVMDIVLPYMLTHPTRPSLSNVLRALHGAGRNVRQLGEIARLFQISLAEAIDERFEHPLPKAVLASLTGFHHMTQDGSGWALVYLGLCQRVGSSRFIGGSAALPHALERCLTDHRGRVRTSAKVEALTMAGGRVTGVRLTGGQELRARAVVTTCSPKTTLTRLLPKDALPEHLAVRARHIPTTVTEASALKIDMALRGRLSLGEHQRRRHDNLDLRLPINTWSTFEDYLAAWDALAARRWPSPIPYIATVPTAADPSQAPEGMDTLWLYSGLAPIQPDRPWDEVRDEIASAVIVDAARYYDGIEELEIGRSVIAAPDIQERFNAIDGNVYHISPVPQRTGPGRPTAGLASYSTPIDGLFLSGAGTHPSAGISGINGEQAARAVLRDLKDRSRGLSSTLRIRPSRNTCSENTLTVT